MKIQVAAVLFGAFLAPAVANAQSSTPPCPKEQGAYLLKDQTWLSMDPVHSIGFKTTNMAGAAFSYGAAKARIKALFRDPHSPYELTKSNTLAICLVNLIDSGRNLTVARLDQVKQHREISMASLRMWTGINAQVDPKAVIEADVTKEAPGTYLLKSRYGLSNGEYILFTIIPDIQSMAKANNPTSLGGYDVSIAME